MTADHRRVVLYSLSAMLVAASLLPAGSALGHGGETGPGHHDDDVPGKQSQSDGATGTKGGASDGSAGTSAREGGGKPAVDGQPTSGTATRASDASGTGGSPVPHFIGLVVLAAIGTGVLIFRRNRQRHAAESG